MPMLANIKIKHLEKRKKSNNLMKTKSIQKCQNVS